VIGDESSQPLCHTHAKLPPIPIGVAVAIIRLILPPLLDDFDECNPRSSLVPADLRSYHFPVSLPDAPHVRDGFGHRRCIGPRSGIRQDQATQALGDTYGEFPCAAYPPIERAGERDWQCLAAVPNVSIRPAQHHLQNSVHSGDRILV